MSRLSHLDRKGKARMVNISEKPATVREAVARGTVAMKKSTLQLIRKEGISKGDVLGVARVAAIMAAKKTPFVIPMCHPINISSVEIGFKTNIARGEITIEARVRTTGPTGVEMEALTAVSVAALTIYDMCKSVDKEMTLTDILLMEKSGGKSGLFKRKTAPGCGSIPAK